MSPRASSNHTAAAALVYWLMVMCGLAGLSVLRMNTPRDFVPLWVGSVAGVALGQLLGWLRLRVWLIAVMSTVVVAASPIVFAVLYGVFGSFSIGIDTCLLAFVPAAICGYLSLSERGGLIAFWYPAMLWMVVILDRPSAGAFDMQTALPLVVGLGGLFVVFLRSRETRRTAIWSAHFTQRLAEPLSRTVLRTSPLRSASQHLWTAVVGAAALGLAAWVAPHLWQKEAAHPHPATTMTTTEPVLAAFGDPSGEQCCTSEDLAEERRERVKEYFPLKNGHDSEARHAPRPPCTHCQSGKRARTAMGGAKGGYSGSATPGHGKDGSSDNGYWATGYVADPSPTGDGTAGNGYGNGGAYGAYGSNGYGNSGITTPDPQPPVVTAPEPLPFTAPLAPPLPFTAGKPVPTKVDVASAPAALPDSASAPTYVPPHATASSPSAAFVPSQPAGPRPHDGGVPWRSALALCMSGIALHLALRAVRRQLTLRHLARPFWRETLDQRVSNHWQRMLIGLRDAGIHPKGDEQPQALAKRVGIEGMSTCATILERVRHGVRVDADDLAAMDAAAATVYHAAREKAGAGARAAALVRSPL
jgi:hypothetical protein